MTKQDTAFGERAAAHYEAWYETPNGQQVDKLEKALLGQLLRVFSQADNVLEIGCGTGHFARWLSGDGLLAVGVDLSAAMLAEARVLGGVPLVRGDAQRLSFVDGAFDLTVLITTLEFLGQPRDALVEALRVSRQGSDPGCTQPLQHARLAAPAGRVFSRNRLRYGAFLQRWGVAASAAVDHR